MVDEINFVDLACLLQLTPDMVLEKFGSAINASIFDASNLAGSLKQKGLIEFTSFYPGPNTIAITDAGKSLLAEAEAKSVEPYDTLDEIILSQLSTGKKAPAELQNTLNLRPRDLALRLYKTYKQGFVIYDLKSGGVELLLTEKGFLKANPTFKPKPKLTPKAPTEQAQKQEEQAVSEAVQIPPLAPKPKSNLRFLILVLIAIIVIVLLIYFKI